jgi:uncharacterized protein (DUF1778 family)
MTRINRKAASFNDDQVKLIQEAADIMGVKFSEFMASVSIIEAKNVLERKNKKNRN